MFKLLSSFARMSVAKTHIVTSQLHTTNQINFRNTPVLFAEPLKKKKKMDPAVVKQREERKRKKLEKQIRRLEKNARQLKPIDELEVPLHLIDEKELRERKLPAISPVEHERRALLNKKWALYRMEENLKDFKILDRMVNAQNKALQELRLESEELYQAAIHTDMEMIPFKVTGPVATPPKANYDFVDGDYNDFVKKWDGSN